MRPMEPGFLQRSWGGLEWTEWLRLDAPSADFRVIPTGPGVYRVRVQGQTQLSYIGQTRMGLRARLRMLARHTYADPMPFNDPHTAAPGHWVWRTVEGLDFACSAARVDLDDAARCGLEDFLLWQYRVESGASTLCNYGRFHAAYLRPSNRGQGRAGERLPEGELNAAAGPSLPPLKLHGAPHERDWMHLAWSELAELDVSRVAAVPAQPGLYKIIDRKTPALLYIGESGNLASRLRTHARRAWHPYAPEYAVCVLPPGTLAFQWHELESDLLGAYFHVQGKSPTLQYSRDATRSG